MTVKILLKNEVAQLAIICSNLKIETLEQGVKYDHGQK